MRGRQGSRPFDRIAPKRNGPRPGLRAIGQAAGILVPGCLISETGSPPFALARSLFWLVVTLIEPHEISVLGVSGLEHALASQHITWLHLPIRDVSVSDARFEQDWMQRRGEPVRTLLRSGSNVLLQCKGGLGRAGMIAVRLMLELGHAPNQAVAAVRAARPGAIETCAQLEHVHAAKTCPEPTPLTRRPANHDRALGAFLGLAVGDALGTTMSSASATAIPRSPTSLEAARSTFSPASEPRRYCNGAGRQPNRRCRT